MTQLDALVTAQTKATKALKDFFLTEEKGSAKYEENLIKHIVSLDKATQAVINQAAEVNKLTEAHNKQKAALEAISNYEKQRAIDFINGANQMANAEANRFAIIHQGVQQQIADRQAERAAFERLAGKGLRSDYTESGVIERGSAAVQQILAKNAALAEQDRLYERIAFNMAKGGLHSDAKESGVIERGSAVVQQILSENAALEQQERLRERIAFQMMSGGLQRGLHQDSASEGGGIEYIQRQKIAEQFKEWDAEIAKSEGARIYAEKVAIAMAADEQWNTKQAQLRISFVTLTSEIEEHKKKIEQLVNAENRDMNAIEMEARALSKKQQALQNVDRQITGSNEAWRQSRLRVQSASYAIQDFVQGLSVGSFSMAVRGAANNVETLASSFTMTAGAGVAMGVALLPTLALVGVSIYEIYQSSKKAKEGHDEAAEAAKRYVNALNNIRDANQAITKTEKERQEAVAQRHYAEARELARKEIVAGQQGVRDRGVDNAGDLQARIARDERDLADPVTVRRLGHEAVNTTRNRLEADREALRKLNVAQENMREVENAENQRQQRAKVERAFERIGGKEEFVKNAGKVMANNPNAAAGLRAKLKGAMAGVDGDIADKAADVLMEEAEGQAGIERRAGKDPIARKREKIQGMKDDMPGPHAGAWARDQAKAAIDKEEKELHAMEKHRNSVEGANNRIVQLLEDLNDAVRGVPANNVNRNNANIAPINPIMFAGF